MSTHVTRASHPDRFEISEDGTVLGLASFLDRDGSRIFFHTEVGEQYSGRGLAAELVSAALDATREEGLRIVPMCPYVKAFVQKHHDWDDLVDPVTREDVNAVRTR